jgi:hypothetical protein
VLFVNRDGVPAPTAEAITSLAIQNVWVVGGTDAVGESVLGRLPGAKRLATPAAVADEIKARGLPVNVVFVADESRPVDAAVAGAAVARLGGLLVLTPGGDPAAAEERIQQMGLSDQVDQIVVSKSESGSNIPWVLIVLSAALAAAGLLLLLSAARKRQQTADASPVSAEASPERERRP